jgi:hypothetical protein
MSTGHGNFVKHLVDALTEFTAGKKLPKREGGHVSVFEG